MPITAIRRPLTVTAWLLMSLLCLALSPLLIAVAAVVGTLMRRPQPMLFVRILIAYFARELGVLVACGGLWLASGAGWKMRTPRFQLLHYRLLRWFIHGLTQRALTLLAVDVKPEPSPEATHALERDQPLLFFSRHAGPGDTLLLTDLLLTRYERLPRVVFKDTLTIDPCIDLIGHRLPHAVLNTEDKEECETRIREIARDLDGRGVLLIFPEGGNFTFERRERALRKLRRKGRNREHAAARQMANVLPPHPSGALAALSGNPGADVIFGAHTGLGLAAFPRELWRATPIGRTFETQMWLVPPDERPTDPDRQQEWLYDWWKRIDEWVQERGSESAPADPAAPTG